MIPLPTQLCQLNQATCKRMLCTLVPLRQGGLASLFGYNHTHGERGLNLMNRDPKREWGFARICPAASGNTAELDLAHGSTDGKLIVVGGKEMAVYGRIPRGVLQPRQHFCLVRPMQRLYSKDALQFEVSLWYNQKINQCRLSNAVRALSPRCPSKRNSMNRCRNTVL